MRKCDIERGLDLLRGACDICCQTVSNRFLYVLRLERRLKAAAYSPMMMRVMMISGFVDEWRLLQ